MVNISPGGALVITRFESSYSIFANHDYTRLTADFLEGRAGQCLHIRALEVLADWRGLTLEQLAN